MVRSNQSEKMFKLFNNRNIIILFFGVFGLSSSYLKYPYSKISMIELGLGFLVVTYVYLKSSKRQHKHGVLSQWSDTRAFAKMKLNNNEMFLFILGIIMIISPLFSFAIRLLLITF